MTLHNFTIGLFSAVAVSVFFAVMLPVHNAYAADAVTRDYEGCYERSGTETAGTLWMQAPTCTVTITNTRSAAIAYQLTVLNLDADRYTVKDEFGTTLEATHNTNTLGIRVIVQANSTRTLTLAPWDYDPNTTDFWFAAISDSQSNSGEKQPNPVFSTIHDQLQVIHPAFVTNSGDVIGGHSEDPAAHQREYERYDTLFTNWETTMFAVPGDHDAKQSISEYYTRFLGNPNYAFTYGNTRFIAFNTTDTPETEGEVLSATWTWLEEELTQAQEQNIIIIMQHPIIPPEWSNSQGIIPEQRLPLAQLFVDHGVDLILHGDAHGYDDITLDDSTLPGLTGGTIQQLDVGGAGGYYYNYIGDHFFVMIHVKGDNIEHTKFNYSSVELQQEYTTKNDGTETQTQFSITNNSMYEMPYIRAKANLIASDKVYASLDTGKFIPFHSQEIDGVRRGYVELSLTEDETVNVTVKDRRHAVTQATNAVDSTGVITFPELPDVGSQETGITAKPQQESLITVQEWAPTSNKRAWTESTNPSAKTQFTIDKLIPRRQYVMRLNDTVKRLVSSDNTGQATFTVSNTNAERVMTLHGIADTMPRKIAALPAAQGGAQTQIYGQNGKRTTSFTAYDAKVRGGFRSVWLNADNDPALELAVAPMQGTIAPLNIFDDSGKRLASVYPYGQYFKGGLVLQAIDLNLDGKEELAVGPESSIASTILIYRYRPSSASIKQISKINAFVSGYRGGVVLSAGDMDAQGADELIVAPRQQKKKIEFYTLAKPNTSKMKLWKTYQFSKALGGQAGKGFSVATGDVDRNTYDDLVVGSYSGGGSVAVLTYSTKQNRIRMMAKRKVYADGYTGGVNVAVGNINDDIRDDIVVAPKQFDVARGATGVTTLQLNTDRNRLLTGASVQPFDIDQRFDAAGGLNISLTDTNKNWKQEIVVARSSGSSDVRVYAQKKDTQLKQLFTQRVYDPGFTGGITLAQ